MSRESNLRIDFSVSESEKELVDQLCCVLKEWYSIDEITADKNGISIYVWNSEHYHLADVTPLITRIVTTVFPDRNIEANGVGEYSVSDDVHEYDASYDLDNKIILCSWFNNPEGRYNNYRELGTKYCALGSELPISHLNKILKFAKAKKMGELVDVLNARAAGLSMQNSYNPSWQDDQHRAIVDYLRSQQNLNIPSFLKEIKYEDFIDCARIKTLSIGSSVKRIGDKAFKNCKSIREVVIPSNVKELGNGVFANCTALEKAEIACSIDSLPPKLFLNCETLKEVTITGQIKAITKSFQGLPKLETVILPEGLEKLGSEAFADCSSLENINLPQSLKTIADNAFSGCSKLTLNIPAGIQIVSPFEVQDDLLIKAVMCIQTIEEAKKFVHFLGDEGFNLNALKNYKKLIKQYEAEPWYIEYKKQIDQANTPNHFVREEIKKQYFKMPFDEYALPFYQKFVEADAYEQAKQLVEKTFSEKEISKINKALTAFFMLEAGYKYKEVNSSLGITSSLINALSCTLQWGAKEVLTVLHRLKDLCS